MAQDVHVSFGADTRDLDNALRSIRADFEKTGAQLRGVGTEFKNAGGAANDNFAKAIQGAGKAMSGTADSIKRDGEKSSGALNAIKNTLETVTLGVGALAIAATAYLVGVGAAADAFASRLKAAAGATDQTVMTAAELKSISDRAGASLESVGRSFTEMQRKAVEGDEATVKALHAIGLSAADVAGKTHSEVAVRMAEAFSTAKDSSNKAQAGVQLFGAEVAGKLIPQLDQGVAHIEQLIGASHRAGTAIGPEFQKQVDGTHQIFQQLGDVIAELRATFDGMMLQSFGQFKPAIDGLLATFRDLARDVTDLVEWFNALNGANEKAAQSTGVLASAAKTFSVAISDATAWVEKFAIDGVKYLNSFGFSLDGLGQLAKAFGADLSAMAATAAANLWAEFKAAIDQIIKAFADLADAAKAALSFNFDGVSAAYSRFKSDAAEVKDHVSKAFAPELFSRTEDAWRQMRAAAGAYGAELDKIKARIDAQAEARRKMIAEGGAKADSPEQTRGVGNPRVKSGAQKADDSDTVRAAMTEIETKIQAEQAGLERKRALYAEEAKLFAISQEEKIAKTKAAVEAEIAAERALLEQEKAIGGLKESQKAQIEKKLEALTQRSAQEQQKIAFETAERVVGAWHKMVDAMSSSISSSIMGMIEHTKSFADAVRNVARSVVQQFVQMGVQMIADWAKSIASRVALNMAGEQAMTAGAAAGAAERGAIGVAEAASSLAQTVARVVKSIAGGAGETAAGVSAFLAPLIGPAAPAAGAAAGAAAEGMALGIAAMDIGAYKLPGDMLAMVHRNELVMPAGPAEAFRGMLERGGPSGGGAPNVNASAHFNIQALDGRSVVRALTGNGREVARQMSRLARNGAGLGARGLAPI